MERVLAHLNVGDHVAVGRVVHLRLARARYALGEDIASALAELLAEERAPSTEDALLLDDLTSGAFAARFGLS